jgi:hypothetical protein
MGRKTSKVPSKVNKELAALNHRGEDIYALHIRAQPGFEFLELAPFRDRPGGGSSTPPGNCGDAAAATGVAGVCARESGGRGMPAAMGSPWPSCCSSACTFRSNCPRCFSMRRESASPCAAAISTPARRGHGGSLSGNCTKIHGNSPHSSSIRDGKEISTSSQTSLRCAPSAGT